VHPTDDHLEFPIGEYAAGRNWILEAARVSQIETLLEFYGEQAVWSRGDIDPFLTFDGSPVECGR